MSSTNVHSEQKINNIYCASAQIIPTEREVEIPPKTAQKAPTALEVAHGEGMDILVEYSDLRKDGKLVSKSGVEIGSLGTKAYKSLDAKRLEKQKSKQKEQSSR